MDRLRACVCAALLGGACGNAPAPAPTAAGVSSDYINGLLDVMQEHSVNRARLDWTAFRAQVIQRAQGAQTIPDLYPAISLALGLLDDHHSSYSTTSGTYLRNPTAPSCTAAPAPSPEIPADIGYVRIPSCSGTPAGADAACAEGIEQQIRSRDTAELVGWIVDLRGNGGGTMWPMIAGVGPVLGNGVAGYFAQTGDRPLGWGYQSDGWVFNGTSVVIRTSAPYTLISPAPRVAVLTDTAVASSGEALAVAFRARPNTRSFGSATCGLSTANQRFNLSDGATLFLTVAVLADRTLTPYGGALVPDESVPGDVEAVQRASAWLRGGAYEAVAVPTR
jgi:hypothetical protein